MQMWGMFVVLVIWNIITDDKKTWWRHQIETYSVLLAICAGNSPVNGEFPAQRPVTRSFDVFFDLRLNIRLSKQSWGWWFETPSCPLWRHCNERSTAGDKKLVPTIERYFFQDIICFFCAPSSNTSSQSSRSHSLSYWIIHTTPMMYGFDHYAIMRPRYARVIRITLSLASNEWIHRGRDKMIDILQTSSSTFSSLKIFELQLKFHWYVLLRMQFIIRQHWFR